MTQEMWQERYANPERVWSGRVNPWLVELVPALQVGTALDVACGEGADAIWLASNGWQVTAMDFAPAALSRGEAAAVQAGVSDRIDWVEQDLSDWQPEPRAFDLVAVHFFHGPRDLRERVHRAAWKATRGTLLVVGHDPRNATEGTGGPPDPSVLYAAEDVLASLEGVEGFDAASVMSAEVRVRNADDPERIMLDSVLVVTRPA